MRKLTRGLTTAAIALAVSGVVYANGDGNHGSTCSDATLEGLYVFSASGFSIVAGVAQPRAIVELIRFHGDGTLSVPAGTLSVNGVITRVSGGSGTYAIAADCTGSLAFGPPGSTFDLYPAPSGSEVHMIFTGGPVPGLGVVPGVLQGIADRVSR